MWRYAELTKTQKHVVDLMRTGWELGIYDDGSCRIQKGGLGRGGEVQTVNRNTANALGLKGVIKQMAHGFPLTRYTLNTTEEEVINA